jgi:hypothetical protein
MTHAGEHAEVVGVEAYSDSAHEALAHAARVDRVSSPERRASVQFSLQAVER